MLSIPVAVRVDREAISESDNTVSGAAVRLDSGGVLDNKSEGSAWRGGGEPTAGRGVDVATVPGGGDESVASRGEEKSPWPGGEGVVMVEVGLVSANPWQPRQTFDEAGLQGLADSIRRSGLMQPIVVRPAPADEATGRSVGYELVAGERRWRAAQMAGLERVPAVVCRLSDVEAAEWALVENLEREDLNPIEQGWGLRRLMERFGLTQAQAAERVGLERSSVANLVRLTELDEETAGLVASGRLSAGHAKVLLGIPSAQASIRASMAKRAVREEWSVRRTEREVAAFLSVTQRKGPPKERYVSPAGADLERRLSEHLGTRVRIATDRSGTSGRVIIEFYGLDQLDGVLEKVGVKRVG